MLLQFLWWSILTASLVHALLTRQGNIVLPAVLEGTAASVTLSLQLLSGYLFFCGMMQIVNKLKICQYLCRAVHPATDRLIGRCSSAAQEAVCMNLSANLLGLGNAATPYGMQAARHLEDSQDRHGLYMLLILNATGLQLLPTTVLTLRIAAGSSQPNAIIPATLVSTGAATLAGVMLGLLCQKTWEVRHGS